MTEKELRQAVCRRALDWLGRKESDGGHREIIDRYNAIRPLPRGYKMTYTDPWCAAFVSAVGAECSLTAVLLPECGCEPMIALYRAAGRWEEADDYCPRPGDLIFYDWEDAGAGDCRGAADHVGLVTEAEGDLLTVTEGNLSDAVGQRKIHAGARFIRGFARPDYASAADDDGTETPPPCHCEPVTDVTGVAIRTPLQTGEADCRVGLCPPRNDSSEEALALPVLRRGDTGETVRAAQLLLIGRGYRCGPWGADGDFGAATAGAVYRFQQGRRLTVDGLVGPETWSALLALPR